VPYRFVDLSHTVTDGLVTYPGLPAPTITDHLSRADSRDRYAPGVEFHIGRIDMVANTGTYLDTPFHRYADGHDLAALPLERVAGVPGVVIGPDDPLPASGVTGHAVLVRTGWDEHWGTERYGDPSHPFVSAALTDALVAASPALVGIDGVNIDDTRGGERPVHSALLAAGIPIVEHLTNLDQLPPSGFEVFAVPVKVTGMGTFPVRAFAMLPA